MNFTHFYSEAFSSLESGVGLLGLRDVRIGLAVQDDLPLPNGCRFVIGAIQWVDFEEELQAEDGFLDLASAGTIAIGGLDAYHTAERVARLSYAKAGRPLESREDFRDGWD